MRGKINNINGCWRRRRDSNPRYGFRPYNGLANRRLQPLGHVSGDETSVSATSAPVKEAPLQGRSQPVLPKKIEGSSSKMGFAAAPQVNARAD
jgi:hypothetical protein